MLKVTNGIEKSELSVILPIWSMRSTSEGRQLKLGNLNSETAKKFVAFFIVRSKVLNSSQK